MDLNWLNDITNTKQAWVYLLFSFIGLYASIFFTTVEEKRLPKWWDLYLLTGSLPFVWGAALLADMTPWVSFVIGVASERAYNVIRKKGLKFTFGQDKGLSFGSEEEDDEDEEEEEEEERKEKARAKARENAAKKPKISPPKIPHPKKIKPTSPPPKNTQEIAEVVDNSVVSVEQVKVSLDTDTEDTE